MGQKLSSKKSSLDSYRIQNQEFSSDDNQNSVSDEECSVYKIYQLGGFIRSYETRELIMQKRIMEYISGHPSEDPGVWTHFCDLPSPRAFFTSFFYNNKIYIAGGILESPGKQNRVRITNTALYVDLQSKTCHEIPPMQEFRYCCSSFIVNDLFYVIGGKNKLARESNVGEVYDIQQRSWRFLPPIPLRVKLPRAVTDNKFIYVFGTVKDRAYLQIYDLETEKWSRPLKAPKFVDVYGGVPCYADNKIFISVQVDDIFIYNIDSKKWTRTVPNTASPRASYQIIRINNYLVIAGGVEVPSRIHTDVMWLVHIASGSNEKQDHSLILPFAVSAHSMVTNSPKGKVSKFLTSYLVL